MKQSHVFSVYYPESGEFTGQVLTVPADHLANNLGQGLHAFPGRHDRERFAVGQADDGFGNLSPALVRRLPPRPEDTPAQEWEWCEQADNWIGVPTLSGSRLARWQEIKSARDTLASLPTIMVQGRSWQVDDASRAAMRHQLDAADFVGAAWSTIWTLSDNTRATVTAATLRAVLAAYGMRANSAQQHAQTLRDALHRAQTVREINAISWTAGAEATP